MQAQDSAPHKSPAHPSFLRPPQRGIPELGSEVDQTACELCDRVP